MTTKPFTRAFRLLAFGLALTAFFASTPAAGASPKASDPFTPSEVTGDNCQPGAECTASATADGQGAQVVSASTNRPAATLTDEWTWSNARGTVTTRAPEGSEPLRVTFTWRVDSATTSANSTTLGGIAVGRIFAVGRVWGCSSCEVVDTTDAPGPVVASSYSHFGPVPPERAAAPGSVVTHTVTVNGRDGEALRAGTRMTLSGIGVAYAYVGGPCYETGCETASHSGSASAEARLKLLSITMARGDDPDQPVLLEI